MEHDADAVQHVTIGKNEKGAWCVFIDGRIISAHATRDGAATSANNHLRALRG